LATAFTATVAHADALSMSYTMASPEPMSMILIGGGLLAVALIFRGRAKS